MTKGQKLQLAVSLGLSLIILILSFNEVYLYTETLEVFHMWNALIIMATGIIISNGIIYVVDMVMYKDEDEDELPY